MADYQCYLRNILGFFIDKSQWSLSTLCNANCTEASTRNCPQIWKLELYAQPFSLGIGNGINISLTILKKKQFQLSFFYLLYLFPFNISMLLNLFLCLGGYLLETIYIKIFICHNATNAPQVANIWNAKLRLSFVTVWEK